MHSILWLEKLICILFHSWNFANKIFSSKFHCRKYVCTSYFCLIETTTASITLESRRPTIQQTNLEITSTNEMSQAIAQSLNCSITYSCEVTLLVDNPVVEKYHIEKVALLDGKSKSQGNSISAKASGIGIVPHPITSTISIDENPPYEFHKVSCPIKTYTSVEENKILQLNPMKHILANGICT